MWRSRCDRDGVTLTLAEVARPVHVHVDAMRLRQIIDNLMENALRVSPHGSQIHLAIHTDAEIADGLFAVIEVRDQGPGIAPEHHERVFERFFRVDKGRARTLGGSGLGLSLVKHLCQTTGSNVGVRSNPGHGAVFWVSFPYPTAAGERSEER